MSRLPAMSARQILSSAIRSFDVDTVEKLLKSDLEIECGNEAHDSALYIALKRIAAGTTSLDMSGFKKKSNKHLNLLSKSEAFRRMVKLLLESGRFNVNALTHSCQTALHLAIEYCKCKLFRSQDYNNLITAIMELLLKNNANINAKTCLGKTPLMKASESGCSHVVQLLLDWRDELGVGVDLNARDIYGETALIKAAKHARVDIVNLLLKHGCFDEVQDHRGFYALHAVIYGPPGSIDDVSSEFLQSIGVDASEKTIKMLDQYGANTFLGPEMRNNWLRNRNIQNIVRMLIKIGQSDVNSLDFRGNTVLDVAFKSKVRISQETVDILMNASAAVCVLMNKDSANSENTVEATDKLGKTPLHRLCVALSKMTVTNRLEVFDSAKLLNSSPFKELFEAMAVSKDYKGRTALHYAVMTRVMCGDDAFLLENALKLAHIFNNRDNYGRTPLHYCGDEGVFKYLVKQGADEHVQDIDGKTPQDLKQLRKQEHNRHGLPSEVISVLTQLEDDEFEDDESKDNECRNEEYTCRGDEYKESTDDKRRLQEQSIPRKIDTWMIWRDSEYAYRDQLSTIMRDKVQQFMNRLSVEIGRKYPRFECRPVLIGSAEEGTKTGLADEFDFNFILTKLSDVCEVVPSPEAPSGFFHVKRRSCISEYELISQGYQAQEGFDGLFSSVGFLLTTEIASRFRILYLQIMSEPEFWDGENDFEWDTCNEIGLVYSKEEEQYNDSDIPNDFRHSTNLCNSIRLILNRPIEGRYMFTPISIDIVPCIKVKDWWPDETLSSVSDNVKQGGCHLVFDQPQRKYPWVPFSDPFARISFAPAEGRIIKECSAVARAAYMVGKQLLYYYDKSKLVYVLKTCLLYCIEALMDNTNIFLPYEDIDPSELKSFVEILMLCFHEFYQQDFLPCYFMPSFHLPIEEYLKSNHDLLLSDSNFQYPDFAYKLYSIVCATESPVAFCPPTPDPLNERFNREELMRKLSMDRGYIAIYRRVQPEFFETGQMVWSDGEEPMRKLSIDRSYIVIYRRVQPESLETGQMVWSDSGSGPQVGLNENRKRRMQVKADETKVKRQYWTET